MSTNVCALCRQPKELRRSHIVPKFAGKWLKATSATGFLRTTTDPENRVQDLPTLPMLCQDCEQVFSKLELYFASKIYYPHINEKLEKIPYDDTLLRFIISINWRTLVAGSEEQIKYHPWIKTHVDKAEKLWRDYLLGLSSEVPSEHHMFFLGFLKENSVNVPRSFQTYIMRATDSTLVSNESDLVYAYTHFPEVVFVSTIIPASLPDWQGTKICLNGIVGGTPGRINDGRFGDFLISRSKIIESATIKTDDQIVNSIIKNPDRFLNSKSFTLLLEEGQRRRQWLKRNLPKGIIELLSVIDRSFEKLDLTSLEDKKSAYAFYLIANELSELTGKEAADLNWRIYAALKGSIITRMETYCKFESETMILQYVVCFLEDGEKQKCLAQEKLNDIIRYRKNTDTRFVIVIINNLEESDPHYEIVYYPM